MFGPGCGTDGELGNDSALFNDATGELTMSSGVNSIQPGGRNGDADTAGVECALMADGIDTQCQSAGDDKTG
jgi:hypothetical protein